MLNISVAKKEDTVHVELEGRMDGSPACSSLRTVVCSAIDQGHRNFVFDLSHVASMSSHGIGCLVASHVSINKVDGSMILVSPNERIVHTLEVTNLVPGVFRVVREEAHSHGA